MLRWIQKCLLVSLIALFSIISIVYAKEKIVQEIPKNFPNDLLFQSQPIDPLCITRFSSGDLEVGKAIKIEQCSKHPEMKQEKVDHKLLEQGYTGFDYTYQASPKYLAHGLSYYKYLGEYNGDHLLYVIESGGGSGFMTSIILVKRKDDELQFLKLIASGDRCNGGINEDIKYQNGSLGFRVNITPYQMVKLSKFATGQLKPYDDLADCAACCIGEALFEYDLKGEEAKLISVRIEKSLDSVVEQGKYQACFNELINNYRIAKKINFNLDDLKYFGENFNKKCQP